MKVRNKMIHSSQYTPFFLFYQFATNKMMPISIRLFFLRLSHKRLFRTKFTKYLAKMDLDVVISELEKYKECYTKINKIVNMDNYCNFFREINYMSRFPKYSHQYQRSLSRKVMEHFLSFEILKPKSDGIYIDVAAASSPVYIILREKYGVTESYRQDLNLSKSKDKYLIVSNACEIPLPSKNIDGITLHNSWEHFEGQDDINFLSESTRLLKPGGKLCILPLELSVRTEILTSPLVWESKYPRLKGVPFFDPNAFIYINEEKKQRQEKKYSVSHLANILKKFRGKLTFEIIHNQNLTDNHPDLRNLPADCRIGSTTHFAEFVLVGTVI